MTVLQCLETLTLSESELLLKNQGCPWELFFKMATSVHVYQSRMVEVNPNLLEDSELQYELYVRGVTVSSSDTTRSVLKQLVKAHLGKEVLGSCVEQLDLEAELEAISDVERELWQLLIWKQQPWDPSHGLSRVGTAFAHCALRLRRIIPRTSGRTLEKLTGLAKSLACHRAKIMEQCPGYDFPELPVDEEWARREVEVCSVHISQLADSDKDGGSTSCRHVAALMENPRQRGYLEKLDSDQEDSSGAESETSSDSRTWSSSWSDGEGDYESSFSPDAVADDRGADQCEGPDVACIDLTCQFSGGMSEDLIAFLAAMEEYGESNAVSEEDLVALTRTRLVGNAKSWYEPLENKPRSWDSFKLCLKRGFLPWADDHVVKNVRKNRETAGNLRPHARDNVPVCQLVDLDVNKEESSDLAGNRQQPLEKSKASVSDMRSPPRSLPSYIEPRPKQDPKPLQGSSLSKGAKSPSTNVLGEDSPGGSYFEGGGNCNGSPPLQELRRADSCDSDQWRFTSAVMERGEEKPTDYEDARKLPKLSERVESERGVEERRGELSGLGWKEPCGEDRSELLGELAVLV